MAAIGDGIIREYRLISVAGDDLGGLHLPVRIQEGDTVTTGDGRRLRVREVAVRETTAGVMAFLTIEASE